MRQSREQMVNDQHVRDGFVLVTNADSPYQMTVRNSLVLCDTTDGAITVTLPPVAEAAGKIFTIGLDTDGGTDVTVTDYQTDSWYSTDIFDITMADAGDGNCLYSDGKAWWTLTART
uniref:Uncharacterized protein n=1 Tax=viral metagenome TaxID=1070528 RepID=A0A6M3JTV1_9ZZZZ